MLPADTIIRLVSLILFGGLGGIIGVQLLTGQINSRGLFYGFRRDGSRYLSPERIQLLLLTLAFGFQYVMKVAQLQSPTPELPPIESSWIALMGGSHAVYLTRKLYSLHFSKPDSQIKPETSP